MEISRLYLGSIAGPLGPATPFNGFLIKHPKGIVMVDTGFGLTMGSEGPAGEFVWGEYRFPWIRRTTTEALADHDLEPGDVKYIVNTHLGDHSGDNNMFTEATFIIQQPEADWHRKDLPFGPDRLSDWDFPGAKLELLAGEDAEILPGVRCVFSPGHTPGHQSVLVEADGVKSLFTGDATYSLDIWDDPDAIKEGHPAFMMQVQIPDGLDIWKRSVDKLAALQPDVVYFAHDANILHGAHRRHAH
jgi:glyoxylase-like metal-dependent hydrolase (beta-lactamase superfamily II)